MRIAYKYIYFKKVADKPKTSVWYCASVSNNDLLGEIKWYPAWRQYCFFPEAYTVFNITCLADINNFIKQLRDK